MKIHILRHAKTEPESTSGLDIDRKLAARGIRQVKELLDFLPDLTHVTIHISSSTRTRQTLEIITENRQVGSVFFTEDLYLCTRQEIIYYLNQLSGSEEILIIGHNNGLSDFVSYISGEQYVLQTCGYLCFELKIDSWAALSKETAVLINSFRPQTD